MLFSDRSLITMLHGIGGGGGALLALSAAWYSLWVLPAGEAASATRQARATSWLLLAVAILVWLTVLGGTYLVFPPYRTPPPEGVADLSAYPRALLLKDPSTAWLHSFAMEIKEHVPWFAAMIATAIAFAGARYRSWLLGDPEMRRMLTAMTAVCFGLVAWVALLGVFVNKAAPLE
jgi:hypothetical protein